MDTLDRRRSERLGYAHLGHGHEHCPVHCRFCGPDAVAWDVGEIVVAVVSLAAAVLGWLVRRPAAVLALALIAGAAWLVAGPI